MRLRLAILPALFLMTTMTTQSADAAIICGGQRASGCTSHFGAYDAYYQFFRGHNWTDQNMGTDYCKKTGARLSGVKRTGTRSGGCCGYAQVLVTCR